ncbi:efflux RND transporter periplasmic adaptor subunit [Algiphilus sp. W345]|uniref:Efflux RND transporter periplasmic adaptor subunit n=1 Tax=Banduia mediterranea TaxID=3075609 RepID=A0ABU2WI70_9GAMM|nr:efflux RND transporter periplasmic adaptor subunit [Algiphilus sp. W345]MDT0496929.1 efflux RND transporter periplasmic adaptor subunit [Algiphilus sp. W345]
MATLSRLYCLSFAASLGLLLAACGTGEEHAPPPPAKVGIVTVKAGPVPIINELPGRLSPTRVAQVRARVSGIVLERKFEEGSEVKADQVLFQIDPAPLRAAYNNARAALAQAQADAFQAQALAKRYATLIDSNAVSRQEYDDAVAAQKQTQAQVDAARANLDTARINLDYASVKAPISGRIGRALVTEGALVGEGEATLLATIRQLDPIYADFTQSAADLNDLRRRFEAGKIKRVGREAAQVRLVTDHGEEYPHGGKLLFSDVSVDPDTAQVSLRGLFPNPDGELLPGAYVRVRIEQAVSENAITVPQQAIQRNSAGQALVSLVVPAGGDGKPGYKAEQIVVELGNTVGDRWIVEQGLKQGDKLIVEGLQHAKPGSAVAPRPWQPETPIKPGESPKGATPPNAKNDDSKQ